MKTEFVRVLFPFVTFLVCGAIEEALPKVWAVGFPLLIEAALIQCCLCSRAESVLLAVLSGMMEDALSALPFATTASFLILASLCVRAFPAERLILVLAYPLYQLWLIVWTNLPAGELWLRLLISVPLAMVAVFVVRPIICFYRGRLLSDAR